MISKKGIALLLFLFILLVFAGTSFAGQVSKTTAWQVAQNFVTNHFAVHCDWEGNHSPVPASIEVVTYKGEPVAYLVTVSPSGHLLMAYYDDFSPVLFYSPNWVLDPAKADNPNALESWIIPEIYNNVKVVTGKVAVVRRDTGQTVYVDTSKKISTEMGARIAAAWARLNVPSEYFKVVSSTVASPEGNAAAYASSAGPLLQTSWSQGDPNDNNSPYNEYTPAGTDNGGCTHTYTGCVATATSQVMKYWNWPASGTGSNSYTWSETGASLSASFAHPYNWSNMPASLSSSTTATQNSAVARLMSDVGISVNMDYGCSESGAGVGATPPSLSTYFFYSSSANFADRSNYDATDWINLVLNEINAATPRPVLFSITTTDSSGHEVVIDGYQTESSGTDQVHLNYGWGGESDGYYDITNNWTTGEYTWVGNTQQFVIGIEPAPSTSCSYALSPTNQNFSSSAGAGSVSVTPSSSACPWTATSQASWITITSGISGTGNGSVVYSVSANPTTSSRSGFIYVPGYPWDVEGGLLSPAYYVYIYQAGAATNTYSISGTVTISGGTGLPGVTMTLSGTSSATTTTESDGSYSFTGLSNGSYTISPGLSGYTFSPSNLNLSVNGANVTAQNITGTVSAYSLTVTLSGTGTGTVTSTPGGISCGSTCSASYSRGTSVTLTSAPTSGSTFTSWSGCDSTSGTTCTVAMTSPRSVTATFTTIQVVEVGSSGAYSTIQNGYNATGTGADIEVQAGTTYVESDNFNRNVSVSLIGGYNSSFTTDNSYSVTTGPLIIRNGTVTVRNLIIQ
ncbi:MAG: C10 family peptidase [Dissulfurispiraceae bacterium]|jgi:hypothetical protein